jgi:hypothetical protein
MKNKLLTTLLTITLIAAAGASTASAQSLLNKMRIEACLDLNSVEAKRLREKHNQTDKTAEDFFKFLVELERKRGLVLDVRPFAINQTTGKLSFGGDIGRVSVINMNPFVYRYDISVAQQELLSSAVGDFLDFLLPPTLRPAGRAESGAADKMGITKTAEIKNRLSLIAQRLDEFNETKCPNAADAGCQALVTLKKVFKQL